MQIRVSCFGNGLSIRLNPKAMLNLSHLPKLKEEFSAEIKNFLIHHVKQVLSQATSYLWINEKY